jgi:polyisoprenoid-binding protein YceI
MRSYLLGAAVAALLSSSALAAPATYVIDKQHMDVTYALNHLGFSTSKGRFGDVDATLTLDPDAPAASKVSATIKVDSIDSGDAARDKHLKSADFFDVEKYPTITFVSTKVTPTGPKTAQVAGDLTIHGVTKPVVLDTVLTALGPYPMGSAPSAGIHATVTVKRSEYGVKAYVPAVGDDVTIVIDAEFHAPK